MIRSRDGNFQYDPGESDTIIDQANQVIAAGSDGIVFGALKGDRIDYELCSQLARSAQTASVSTTFHRAFDALPDPSSSISLLLELGLDRILTSGTAWDSGQPAEKGLPVLRHYISSHPDIEWVIGGGVGTANARKFVTLTRHSNYSLHAYSAVQIENLTSEVKVRSLVDLVSDHQSQKPDGD